MKARLAHYAAMICFFINTLGPLPAAQAQEFALPSPGVMVNMTPKFDPMMVKGIKLYPDNPFKFDFIVDTGDMELNRDQVKDQGQKLAAYFLASLTTPESQMWVNLSPYEKSRIIPPAFGDTEMGKELLSEDYMLKQIMATALYPERQLGKEFWQRVYEQSARQFGTTNVPVNTFNKVWIVPDEAVVYENVQLNSVFVVQSRLKVMLEKDYLAQKKNLGITPPHDVGALGSQIIREIVLPALTREVNEGKNFAGLRQVYQSLILAAWYKKNLRDNVLAKGYVDRGKTLGVDTKDKQITEKIYQQYLKAYRKGVYNYIKEEVDPATHQMIPRKYFSGGFTALGIHDFAMATPAQARLNAARLSDRAQLGRLLRVTVAALALGGAVAGSSTQAQAAGVKTVVSQQNSLYYSGSTANLKPSFAFNGQAGFKTLETFNNDLVSAPVSFEPRDLKKELAQIEHPTFEGPVDPIGQVVADQVVAPAVAGPTLATLTKNVKTAVDVLKNPMSYNVDGVPGPSKTAAAFTPLLSGAVPGFDKSINDARKKLLRAYIENWIRTIHAPSIDMTRLKGRESSGNKNAESPKGALGLYQILPQKGALDAFLQAFPFVVDITPGSKQSRHNRTVTGFNPGTVYINLYDPGDNLMLARFQMYVEIPIELEAAPAWPVTERNMVSAYNVGVGNLKRGKKAAANYVDVILGVADNVLHKKGFLKIVANQAMITNPQVKPVNPVNGGIDLGQLALNTKGHGVRTAFSDPRILQMLLDAKGLFPQVEAIETVTVPVISALLGASTAS
jgi:hypothetical protein